MTQCKGYRYGTDCKHITRSPQNTENWENWQLCYYCARKLHPKHYKHKRHHGVNRAKELYEI